MQKPGMNTPLPLWISWPEKTVESLPECLEQGGIDIAKFDLLDGNTISLRPLVRQRESYLVISLHTQFSYLYADRLLTPEILSECKDPGLPCSTSLSDLKNNITLNMLCELFEVYNRRKGCTHD